MHGFDVKVVSDALFDKGGGYQVVHSSPGLEIGIYVLVAPSPDLQTPHAEDEVYVVLQGSATIDVEGERRELGEGDAVFVAAGAEHRFHDYDRVSLLVIFNGPHSG